MTDASDTPQPSATDGPDPNADEIDFENLTLSQRVFVAAVQNPARGVLVALLTLFGLGFYVALWFAFPQVAVLLLR